MSERRSTPKTMRRAAELRLDPTPAEAKLWSRLRAHRLGGIGFRRQHAIGPYITDFCAPGRKLIVELDGEPHLDQRKYDGDRTAFLKSKGYRVLRIYSRDVLDRIETILAMILEDSRL